MNKKVRFNNCFFPLYSVTQAQQVSHGCLSCRCPKLSICILPLVFIVLIYKNTFKIIFFKAQEERGLFSRHTPIRSHQAHQRTTLQLLLSLQLQGLRLLIRLPGITLSVLAQPRNWCDENQQHQCTNNLVLTTLQLWNLSARFNLFKGGLIFKMWIIINLSKWDLFKVLFPNLEQHSEYSKTDWLQWGQHTEIDLLDLYLSIQTLKWLLLGVGEISKEYKVYTGMMIFSLPSSEINIYMSFLPFRSNF